MLKRARLLGSGLCVSCGGPLNRTAANAILCWDCIGEMQRARSRALRLVKESILAGSLRPAAEFKCGDCGDQAQVYDHRRYSDPPKIEPVCRSCNIRRGPAEEFFIAGSLFNESRSWEPRK